MARRRRVYSDREQEDKLSVASRIFGILEHVTWSTVSSPFHSSAGPQRWPCLGARPSHGRPRRSRAHANGSSTSFRAVSASATTNVSFSNATCQTVIDIDCYCKPSGESSSCPTSASANSHLYSYYAAVLRSAVACLNALPVTAAPISYKPRPSPSNSAISPVAPRRSPSRPLPCHRPQGH
jgi:hypothetical protein